MSETIINWRYPIESGDIEKNQKNSNYISVPEVLYADIDIPEWETFVDQINHGRDSFYVENDINESENLQQEEIDLEDDKDAIAYPVITGETLLDIGLCQRVQPLLHDMFITNTEEVYDDKSDVNTENLSSDKSDMNEQLEHFAEEDELARSYIRYQKVLLEAIDSSLRYLKNTSSQNNYQLQADIEEFINTYDDTWKKITAYKNDSRKGVIDKEIENEIDELQQGNYYKSLMEKYPDKPIVEKMIDRLKSHLKPDQKVARPISLYESLIESLGKEYKARRILIKCISQVYRYNYVECNHLSLLVINDGYYENFLLNSKEHILAKSPIVIERYLYGCSYLSFVTGASLERFERNVGHMRKLVQSIDKNVPSLKKVLRYKEDKLKDHNGCFGIMELDNQHRYFSFSGVHDATDMDITSIPGLCGAEVKKSIDELVNKVIQPSGHLKGFTQAICTLDVCSFTQTTSGIVREELRDVINAASNDTIKHNYSCCERKMLARFEKSKLHLLPHGVKSSGGYIFAKYKPCVNCRLAIKDMKNKGITFRMYHSYKYKIAECKID